MTTRDIPDGFHACTICAGTGCSQCGGVGLEQNAPSKVDIMLDPDKYGYEICEHCSGHGSSLKEDSDRCTKCNGLGLIKRHDPKDEEFTITMVWKIRASTGHKALAYLYEMHPPESSLVVVNSKGETLLEEIDE